MPETAAGCQAESIDAGQQALHRLLGADALGVEVTMRGRRSMARDRPAMFSATFDIR